MTPVCALHRIHRGPDATVQIIVPGTVFEPLNAAEASELAKAGAVREITKEELAFYEATKKPAAKKPEGKGGKGDPKPEGGKPGEGDPKPEGGKSGEGEGSI